MRVDKTVLRETAHIAAGEVLLSALMCAGFALCRRFSGAVLGGAALGCAIAVGNFFLMGLSVQAVLGKGDGAAKYMRSSHALLMLLCLALVCAGVLLLKLNALAVILPLLFPTPVILLMRLLGLAPRQEAPSPPAEDGKEESNQ